MMFYDKTRPLTLEREVSEVGLGAGLLQIRDEMNCPQDTASHSSLLKPIVSARKSLSSNVRYGNKQRSISGTA